jgi:tRNA G26 N,N-dimethylase Trm1
MSSETQPDGLSDEITRVLHCGDLASWTLAAVAVALSTTEGASREAAIEVLAATGIDPAFLERVSRPERAAQAAAPLLQAAAIAQTGTLSWADQSDEALRAQGKASALAGPAFAGMVPTIPGMAELLARPEAAILDVGTGIGAMAVSYAQTLPGVRVVGIDVMPRAIELAKQTVATSTVADRVEVRLQGIQELDDIDRYAMAPPRWSLADGLVWDTAS